MRIIQANGFAKAVKKLPQQQKAELDTAVKAIVADPAIGELKPGDRVRVYKFKMNEQLTLLGYEYHSGTLTLYLLKLGSHENFYRDLKASKP